MPDNSREQLQFDVEKYVRLSKKVDISDLDLSQATRYPISDEEIRALTYMTDIESHTIIYLRAILNTCAVEDPQTTAFLSCWAYEEFFHGHTLRQFLNAVGVPISASRIAEVQKASSFFEWLKELGSSVLCRLSSHFHGAYLTYGAISELSTLEGYGVLARKTQNPVLAEIVRRLAKDERRHFSFYYNKARLQLQSRSAQRLTSFIIRHFWLPVGGGVKPDSEVDWILSFILGDPQGAEIARRIDATIAKLPGLHWFDRLSRSREEALLQMSRRSGRATGVLAVSSQYRKRLFRTDSGQSSGRRCLTLRFPWRTLRNLLRTLGLKALERRSLRTAQSSQRKSLSESTSPTATEAST